MASRDEIDRVRSAVNIVDVVAPYVALKRSGPVWKGLCPFHSEKTPSFQVNPDKGFWYCFGQCSTGGDAFKFLEKVENLSFNESLERLANMAGITLTKTRESAAAAGERDRLYNALEHATAYYQQTLAQSARAKQYLHDRGIADDTISSFRLGYAGESFDGLFQYLRKNGVNTADAVEAGVLANSDRQYSAPYDKMRSRIVCPILDVHDRPIAFGGRLMEDIKDRPKYLNTAETQLFSKGKTFFAMSRARKAMGDLGYAIVVEGYFDVISAHQAGFANVLATLGTSLTPDHADMLSRHVQWVILAFDADAAGYKAAQRANAIFETKEFEVQVLDLPKGDDPDSLLRAGKTAEFQRAIDNALPIREFQLLALMEHYQNRQNLSERDKAAIFRRQIVPLLRSSKSVIERERYIRIAAPLHPFYDQGSVMAEDQIRQEVSGAAQPAQRSGNGASRSSGDNGGGWRKERSFRQAGPPAAPPNGVRAAEENLLRALISDDLALSKMLRERAIAPDLFISPTARELAQRMLSPDSVDGGTAALLQVAAQSEEAGPNGRPEVVQLAARLMAGGGESGEDSSGALPPVTQALVEDSILRLEREQSIRQEKQLRGRAEQGDVDAARALMQLLRKMHGGQSGLAGLTGDKG